MKFTNEEIQLVRYFADKYKRMAIERRQQNRAAVGKILDGFSKECLELIEHMNNANTCLQQKETLLDSWNTIEGLVKETAQKYWNDFDSDLCPWSFDAAELKGALQYIRDVITFKTNTL
jgi:hypothetical protein